MSRETNVEFVQRAFAAFNHGDVEAVVSMLTADVEVYSSPDLPNGGTFQGHDGYLEWIGRWLEAWENFQVEAQDDFVSDGENVVVSVHQYGRGQSSRLEVEMTAAFLFTVRDGKALRVHLYPDKPQALEVVGLAE